MKSTAPKQAKQTAIINVLTAAGLIVSAFGTFGDTRDVMNEAGKGAWLTAAKQFDAAGKKQAEALRTSCITEALKTWGESAHGKTKTLTTAVNIAARAVKLGVPMFDGDKVISREKVRVAVSIKEKAAAGEAAGTAPAAAADATKAGAVNILSAESIEGVLHYLSNKAQAAPFAPSILKAAEAAGLRIMTSAELAVITAHYMQAQKAA